MAGRALMEAATLAQARAFLVDVGRPARPFDNAWIEQTWAGMQLDEVPTGVALVLLYLASLAGQERAQGLFTASCDVPETDDHRARATARLEAAAVLDRLVARAIMGLAGGVPPMPAVVRWLAVYRRAVMALPRELR